MGSVEFACAVEFASVVVGGSELDNGKEVLLDVAGVEFASIVVGGPELDAGKVEFASEEVGSTRLDNGEEGVVLFSDAALLWYGEIVVDSGVEELGVGVELGVVELGMGDELGVVEVAGVEEEVDVGVGDGVEVD